MLKVKLKKEPRQRGKRLPRRQFTNHTPSFPSPQGLSLPPAAPCPACLPLAGAACLLALLDLNLQGPPYPPTTTSGSVHSFRCLSPFPFAHHLALLLQQPLDQHLIDRRGNDKHWHTEAQNNILFPQSPVTVVLDRLGRC